jgi:SHAQKYF class myb-like DNA-binding protein
VRISLINYVIQPSDLDLKVIIKMNDEYKANHTKKGRWTKEEQDLFYLAYQWHGKDWKKLGEIIQTRSVIQIRSHAQKIQKKLDKTHTGAIQTQKVYILGTALDDLNNYITKSCSESYKKYIECQNNLMYSRTS